MLVRDVYQAVEKHSLHVMITVVPQLQHTNTVDHLEFIFVLHIQTQLESYIINLWSCIIVCEREKPNR